MMLRLSFLTVCIAACFLGAVQASAAPRAARSSALKVDVAEWSIVPSLGVVRAGRVSIQVRNLGEQVHQLVLVRTTRFAQELHLQGDHALVSPVATPVLLKPGGRKSFVVVLKPGSYLLLDNLPWHYWKGTSVAISVR